MKRLRFLVAGTLGRWALDALMATVRFTLVHEERWRELASRGNPVIYTLWHGRLLPLTYYHRDLGLTTLVSRSEDGEYIARVVEGWGYQTVRGSTSRGGSSGLRQLVRAVHEGRSLAITPDGPRGPRQKLQPGVLTVARLTGAAIMPVTAGCSRAWWPGSWDRFCIPKPFARVRLLYGEPRFVDRHATGPEIQRHARDLEAQMNAMIAEVDRYGGPTR